LLFRIAQEALNNIRKHARASMVIIKVEGGDNDIKMTIADDGQGFEAPGKIEGMVSAGRLGLMGMHERARLLNGTLQIKSAPGQGTELTVTIPWQANK
jgi:signal transduction histidine kinase